MRFVISSRSRASQMRHDDDAGVPVTVTAPSVNPTAPIRSNRAFRAKSYPLGSEGDGGGLRIVYALMMSLGFDGAVRYITEILRRTDISSMPGRSICIRSRVRRYLFFDGATRMTLPDRLTGPIRRSSMGAETAALRNCAAANPAAVIITTSSPKQIFPRRFLKPMPPILATRRTARSHHISGSTGRMKYPPIAGGEQDRCPQANTSVIIRRYPGFTSPARRQSRTQRLRNMRGIPLTLGGYRCHKLPMITLTTRPTARVYRKWTKCVKPRAHCHSPVQERAAHERCYPFCTVADRLPAHWRRTHRVV